MNSPRTAMAMTITSELPRRRGTLRRFRAVTASMTE